MSRYLRRGRPNRSSQGGGHTVTDDDNGDTNISSTDYARKAKLLMDLCKNLCDLGAEAFIDLPRVVVIGSQSAGKSSLVEAVSGINVPRDAGTCTRCPMEISMTHSLQSWSCTISLQSADTMDEEDATFHQFGPTLTHKNTVDIWLRRAQAAILSPHLPPDTFLTKSVDELREAYRVDLDMLKFSPHRVRIDIKDTDAANMQFVDLPGIIQNETQELIDLVKNLVEQNIRHHNTLIVIAIPMSDDMENQMSVKIARDTDPNGIRTLGVLTKPDTIPSGSISARQRWKDILQGKSYQTKHGYFCVRLPDDAERANNTTRREWEKMAAQYFNDTPPWSEFADQSRFGVPNFVTFTSRLLVEMIETSLPKIREDVDRLLSECTEELGELPLPVTEYHVAELINLITAFCNDLKGAVDAKKTKELANLNRARYRQFKAQIYATAPDFRISEIPGQYPKLPYQNIDPEMDPETDDITYLPSSEVLNLCDVHDVIAKSTGWELPGYVPFEATEALIKRFVKLWQAPTESCFNDINGYLTDAVEMFVKSNFSRFKQLENYMISLVQSEHDDCKWNALQRVREILFREEFPYTENAHSFTSTKKQWFEHYKAALLPPYTQHRNFPYEKYHPELEVMAGVRAYFQVSYKRFIDHIPLAIERELNQTFANNIQKTLLQKLLSGPDALSEERMKELLAEDPVLAERRKSLMKRRDRLFEIRQRLITFGE